MKNLRSILEDYTYTVLDPVQNEVIKDIIKQGIDKAIKDILSLLPEEEECTLSIRSWNAYRVEMIRRLDSE